MRGWGFPPERIDAGTWESRLGLIPEGFRGECRSLRSLEPGGIPYLHGPCEYSRRGDRLLGRLLYDSAPESLRLWAFLFSEKDRLFRAREHGWKIIAAMKDLGQVPVLTYAFPDTLTFYADELWWAPCFAEETRLLDEASRLGAGEEMCYVRAALGAMVTLDYFPPPDLCIAGVGACCDDFSAVMQLVEGLGHPVHWWEMPARYDRHCGPGDPDTRVTPFGGSRHSPEALAFVEEQLEGVVRAVEELTGTKATDAMLRESVARFNSIRARVALLRDLVYSSRPPVLPGLEMYLAEFIAIHACSEPEESVNVLDGMLDLVRHRAEKGESPFRTEEPVRVFWVTPPTDASLITVLEDAGGCIAGTEYLISHAFLPLDREGCPVRAVAENCMDDCMTGSPAFRARRIVEGALRYEAEGVIVSGIFGASHCPWDEGAIVRTVREELGIPVLSFDVPYSPGRPSEQVVNRIESFTELLRSRRL